ncbi:hypothetical protein [Endothiovibrio diazotrophicus]
MDERRMVWMLTAVIALLLVTVVITLVVALRWRRRQRAAMGRLGEAAGRSGDGEGSGELAGRRYRFALFPGGRNMPPSLTVALPVGSVRSLALRRERAFDRFFKAIGLAVEPQSGDPAFDRAVYLAFDDRPFARRWLADARVREAIRGLFAAGFTHLECDGEALRAVWRPFKAWEAVGAETVHGAVERLVSLAESLEREGPARVAPDSPWAGRLVAFGIAVGAVVAGTVSLVITAVRYVPLDWFDLWFTALAGALPLTLLFLLLCVPLLRGRANSHVEWSVAAGIALAGLPLAAVGGLGLLNGVMDEAQPRRVAVPLIHKHSVSGKGTSYYLTVASWRGDGEEELKVGGRLYGQLEPGRDRVRLLHHPGRFGLAWVSDVRLADE